MAGSLEEAKDHVETLRHVVKGVTPPADFDVLPSRRGFYCFPSIAVATRPARRREPRPSDRAHHPAHRPSESRHRGYTPSDRRPAVVIALGLASLIGQMVTLSFFIVNVTTTIGLAVGIDYTLLIIQRYREERSKGLDKLRAIDGRDDGYTDSRLQRHDRRLRPAQHVLGPFLDFHLRRVRRNVRDHGRDVGLPDVAAGTPEPLG